MSKPLIGISSTIEATDNRNTFCKAYEPIVTAVARAGGLPVVIAPGLDKDVLRALYDRVDGVLLPGGGDIQPVLYNAEQHPATTRIVPERDETELQLARWAVEDDRPLFGICRGHQVVNVALGGTLIQDIPSQVTSTLMHDQSEGEVKKPRGEATHEVTIDAASRLAALLGKSTIRVNSLHHQANDQPGNAIHFSAQAADGVNEALEIPDHRFALSVQWHPEDMVDDLGAQALFNAFVQAANGANGRQAG
jgi:putative glutamine amidotransferase